MSNDLSRRELGKLPAVAGNGLLDRRVFLRGGAAFAAAISGYSVAKSAAAQSFADDAWTKVPGVNVPSYGAH